MYYFSLFSSSFLLKHMQQQNYWVLLGIWNEQHQVMNNGIKQFQQPLCKENKVLVWRMISMEHVFLQVLIQLLFSTKHLGDMCLWLLMVRTAWMAHKQWLFLWLHSLDLIPHSLWPVQLIIYILEYGRVQDLPLMWHQSKQTILRPPGLFRALILWKWPKMFYVLQRMLPTLIIG